MLLLHRTEYFVPFRVGAVTVLSQSVQLRCLQEQTLIVCIEQFFTRVLVFHPGSVLQNIADFRNVSDNLEVVVYVNQYSKRRAKHFTYRTTSTSGTSARWRSNVTSPRVLRLIPQFHRPLNNLKVIFSCKGWTDYSCWYDSLG